MQGAAASLRGMFVRYRWKVESDPTFGNVESDPTFGAALPWWPG